MFVLLLLGILPLQTPALAQSSQEDSLKEIIHQHTNDNAVFRAYKALGELNEKTDSKKAVRYFRNAISFHFHLEYSNEFSEVYNSLGELYHITGQYDSSMYMHTMSLNIASKFNHPEQIGFAQQGIGLNFLRQSQLDSARYHFKNALSVFTELENPSLQAGVYINLGNVFLDEIKYAEALNQFIKAEKILVDVAPDKKLLSKVLCNIGNIECIIGNYDKAIGYTKRALELSIEIKNDINVAYCHRLNGRIYRKKSDLEKALSEYDQALAIYIMRDDKRNQTETHQNIGNIYYDLHQFKKALFEYKKSLRTARSIANPSSIAYAYSGIGYTYYELRKFDLSIAYFDSSMVKAKEVKNYYLVMDAYEVISNIHQEQLKYKDALTFHRLFTKLKDSLNEQEAKESAKEMEARFQNEKKQTEIDLLNKDQQLKTITLKQNKIVVIALIIALILLITIAVLVFNRYKIISQTKRELELEQIRNTIARDLHDDMGSTLSSINILSQVGLHKTNDQSHEYFQRIGDQSAKMMETMADIVWSINPINDSLEQTLVKMKEFAAEILEPKSIVYKFEVATNLLTEKLGTTSRKNIFLIFKEAINNAAKYSECTEVIIYISSISGKLLLEISDNGKGFDEDRVKSGNGLRNMTQRTNEVHGELKRTSNEGSGTQIKVAIPIA